jgi:AcrR family transcriptional regulator
VADAAVRAVDTRALILDAARRRLLADGYAGLSTRKVIRQLEEGRTRDAGMPAGA